MLKKTLLITALFAILSTGNTQAQASLVPVYHPVYDWMHYQRMRGNASFYNYEALPLTRGQITKLLSNIDPARLSGSDGHVLESYLREFSSDSLAGYKNNSALQGPENESSKDENIFNKGLDALIRTKDLVFSEEEPHLYVWHDSLATITFDYFFGPGGVFIEDGPTSYSAPYYRASGVRTYGTLSDHWGFHYEQWRAVEVGDDEAFAYLPFFSRNWKFLSSNQPPTKNHLEAFAGFQKNFWSVHIGRGMMKYGVGSRNNLVFSRESIPFDWARLNINSKYLRYSLVHGSLSWKPVTRPLQVNSEEYSRVSPNRFMVHQRIQFQPFHWISFGFYELIHYSDRKIEIGYINPVTRLSIMEWELQDQDNGFAGFEGVLRPFKGLELFGEVLVDDLGDARDLFRWKKGKEANSKFGRYFGASYALKTGTVLTGTYQRVDPNVYAHKFILNSHAEKGVGLGSQVGPNGDEFSLGIEQWLSHRTKISFRYDYDRHGLNVLDESGEIEKDVGGSILESYTIDPESGHPVWQNIFLDGDLHRWNRYSVGATYEPWRGFNLTVEYSYRQMLQGDRMDNVSVLNLRLLVGY